MTDNAQMRESAQEEQKPAAKQSDDELERLRARVSELERANELVADLQAGRSFLLSERASREKQEPVVWEGAEQWEPLAMFLCADENGPDSCHELIWEGYPPEPWGERWQKYEREAKRMIDLVSQYAAPPVAAPVRLTDEQAEKVDEAIREALGDAYDCLRVWNAWSYGTMGPDDFSQVAEDPDRVADIRNAAAAALGFKVGS